MYPDVLRCSFQDSIKPKVEFLEKNGLTGEKLLKALQRYPCILSLSISRTMEPRVCFLQSLLDPELAPMVSNSEPDKITRKLVSNHNLTVSAISANPRILASPKEKILVGFVKDVEGMGIEKGSKAFARSFIQLSMMNRDTVKRKLENLMKLEFTEEEVGILVKRMPKLLGYSEDKLRQNLKFLVEEWKLPRNVILSHPMALCLSLETRLKPRLISLRALMMRNKSSKEAERYTPAYYMSMSERDFHCKVVSRLVK
jgi:hypothetical protein